MLVRGDYPSNAETGGRLDQLRASSLAQAISVGFEPGRNAGPGRGLWLPIGGGGAAAAVRVQGHGPGPLSQGRRIQACVLGCSFGRELC